MHDEEYAKKRFDDAAAMGPLVLPHCNDESRRVVYSITEYDPILDSSNMTIQDWVQIAKDIHVSMILSYSYLKLFNAFGEELLESFSYIFL